MDVRISTMEVLKMKKFIFVLVVLIAGFQAPVYALDRNELWLRIEDMVYHRANDAYIDAKSEAQKESGIVARDSKNAIGAIYTNRDEGGIVFLKFTRSDMAYFSSELSVGQFMDTMFARHSVLSSFTYLGSYISITWASDEDWYESATITISIDGAGSIDVTYSYTAESLKNPRRR
jgi:hypothetical protein